MTRVAATVEVAAVVTDQATACVVAAGVQNVSCRHSCSVLRELPYVVVLVANGGVAAQVSLS